MNVRILRFSSDSCSVCASQKKALIVERFKDAEEINTLTELVCAASEEEMKIPSKAEAYRLSETYNVQAFPVLVIEAKLDGGDVVELFRAEGGISLVQLRKAHKEALAEFQVRSAKEAAPWA